MRPRTNAYHSFLFLYLSPSSRPIPCCARCSSPFTFHDAWSLPSSIWPIPLCPCHPTSPLLQGICPSANIDMPPQTFTLPTSSLSGVDREKALRPLLHNATTISVQPAPLPVPVSRPLVHELYAQAFALLPTIHTFYGLLTQKQNLCMIIFSTPLSLLFPKKKLTLLVILRMFPWLIPLPEKLPPLLWKFHLLPFLNWLKNLSTLMPRLRIPADSALLKFSPSDYSTEPLDTPAFDGSMLNHYHDLLHFLHDKLSEYFSSVQDPALDQNFFLTFIVGPPDHINARHSLHSHIIGCHVSPPQDCHSVLFVPVWSRGCLERTPWLGTSPCLYPCYLSLPDLPLSCLYSCTPTSLLRCAPCSLHPLCFTLLFALLSMCLFLLLGICRSRWHFSSICPTLPLLRILINLPLHSALFPPKEVIEAFWCLRETHQQSCYTWRADLLDSRTIAADQHFPFYCTPYYGYSPPSLHDMHTMILELATLLTSFAFLADGSPIPSLGNRLPPPPALIVSPLVNPLWPTWVYTQGKEFSFLITVPTQPPATLWSWPGWPPLLDAHPLSPSFFPEHAYLPLAWGPQYHARPLC